MPTMAGFALPLELRAHALWRGGEPGGDPLSSDIAVETMCRGVETLI